MALSVRKSLVKSSDKIHSITETKDALVFPNLVEPLKQEDYESWGMDNMTGYEASISKVQHEMIQDGVLEDGMVHRKTINKNEFIINSLDIK